MEGLDARASSSCAFPGILGQRAGMWTPGPHLATAFCLSCEGMQLGAWGLGPLRKVGVGQAACWLGRRKEGRGGRLLGLSTGRCVWGQMGKLMCGRFAKHPPTASTGNAARIHVQRSGGVRSPGFRHLLPLGRGCPL